MALRTIASFREAPSAHIARARLEAAGIPAFIADEHLVGVQWFYSDAIGGVKIQVPDAYAEQARELVSTDFSGELRRVRRLRRRQRFVSCPTCDGELDAPTAEVREVRSGRRRFLVFSGRRACQGCGLML